jgi:hypothetical protein
VSFPALRIHFRVPFHMRRLRFNLRAPLSVSRGAFLFTCTNCDYPRPQSLSRIVAPGPQPQSVDGLTGYHTSDATCWVSYISVATRDQMDMGVVDSLSSCLAVVNANVEANYRRIRILYLVSKANQKLVD